MNKKTFELVNSIQGWLSINEGLFLEKATKIVTQLNGRIVEIGSYCGKSTIWLSQSKQIVYAIDPHKGNLDQSKIKPTLQTFHLNIKKAQVDKFIKPIINTSKLAAINWKKPIKLLFIDGLHDKINAQQDFKLWYPYLINNGIVAMHDGFCGWDGTGKAAFNNIVDSINFKEVGVVGSIIYGIKGTPNFFEKINLLRCKFLIKIAFILYQKNIMSFIPKIFKFFLIHRLIKLFLLNRFTFRRS